MKDKYKVITTTFSLRRDLLVREAIDLEKRIKDFLIEKFCVGTIPGYYPFILPPRINVGKNGMTVEIEYDPILERDEYIQRVILKELKREFKKYIKKINPLDIIFTDMKYEVGRQ